jgi:hypothetical protein
MDNEQQQVGVEVKQLILRVAVVEWLFDSFHFPVESGSLIRFAWRLGRRRNETSSGDSEIRS